MRTVVDGFTFDSKKAAARYLVLKEMQAAGEISNLRRQVSYKLTTNGILVCRYRADFVYILDGVEIVEDVKGRLTDVYKLKKKWMAAEYGISILET